MKIARVLIAATAVCTVAAVPAQAAMAAPAHGTARQDVARAGFHLPYTDPQQAGWLTLCGVNLKPITHGSITAMPFVWRVVSDVPAPKQYFVKGAKAQMFAYQPRPYTPAGAWSGTIMGAASLYSDRRYPMAQFTPIDSPLTQMTLAFHPIWDHLIQLRLYLGAPNLPEYTIGYAAADIQVIGNTWTLVAGGHSSCTAGKVVAEEVLEGMPGARGKPKHATSGAASSSHGTASPSADAGGSGSSSPAANGSIGAATDTAAHSSNAGPVALGIGLAVLIAALLTSAGVWLRRRRRITG
jgi:hypothetical protein